MLLLFLISMMFIYEARIETVIFDKRANWVHKSRFRCCSSKKKNKGFPLSEIAKVEAVKRGFVSQGTDTTHFVLVLTLKNGVRECILETKNPVKIKRKVISPFLLSCVVDLC